MNDTESRDTLATLEAERRTELRRMVRRLLLVWIPIGLFFGLFAAGADAAEDRLVITGMAALLGAVPSYFIIGGGPNRWRRRVAEQLNPSLAANHGFEQYDYLGGHFAIGDFREAQLLPRAHDGRRTHVLVGTFNGRRLQCAELELTRTRNEGGRRRLFAGLALRVDLPEATPDGIRIVGERGGLRGWLDRILGRLKQGEPVNLPNAGRSDLRVYADDPAAARRLVTPTLLEALGPLARQGHLKAGTLGDRLLITVDTNRSLLPEPGVFRPVARQHQRRIEQRIAELATVGERLATAAG